ncbi:MAG: ATP-binding cassette domain-containing protein, partial [Spirochaetaceae bacterium]|nr:ATP-binding cassette domain-containing protein [Spirochaetaceae bacterium]
MADVAAGGRGDALQVDDLWVRRGTRDVLQGVSLEVAGGGGLLITGANGTGKTTLLRAILGFLAPRRGMVTFCGSPGGGPAAGQVQQEDPDGGLPINASEVVELRT